MNVNAINSAISCQPIKEVSFSKKHAEEQQNAINAVVFCDCFTPEEQNLEQKYDLACRLAAFYKTQYENLAKVGVAEA